MSKHEVMKSKLLELSPGVGYGYGFLVKQVVSIGSERTLRNVLRELVDDGLFSKSRIRRRDGRLEAPFYSRS